jgi:hypothetical protein
LEASFFFWGETHGTALLQEVFKEQTARFASRFNVRGLAGIRRLLEHGRKFMTLFLSILFCYLALCSYHLGRSDERSKWLAYKRQVDQIAAKIIEVAESVRP